MKILQVTPYFYPVMGGLEKVVLFLSSELANRGHDIHVYTSNFHPFEAYLLKRSEIIRGVKVHRIPILRFHHMLEIPFFRTKTLKKIIRSKFDVVHVHTHLSLFGTSISLLTHFSKAHVVIQVMSVDNLSEHPKAFISTFGPPYEKTTLEILRRIAAQILTRNSRDHTILTKRYGFKKLEILPDGVPAHYFKSLDATAFKKKYNISSDRCVLFIGRLHPWKGPHVLLRSAPLVLKDFPDTTFLFVGPDGGSREELETQILKMGLKTEVKVLGKVSERCKLQALALCDMLVLPTTVSWGEVYPMVISEAWAQRKPVVASCVGGVPSRVKHGDNGLLVKPNDPEGLANSITLLLSDRELGKKMGKKGSESVHTWAEIAKKAENIYLSLI